MGECYYKEIEPNYFVWFNDGIEPTECTEYFLERCFVHTVDEYIQLPYKKIRIRYPDVGINYGFEIRYHHRIPYATGIITYDGRLLPYCGDAYSKNHRIQSLFRFLNSLFGRGYASPYMPNPSIDGHYGFVIEHSTTQNGYSVITECNKLCARRWKDRSNYREIIGERNTFFNDTFDMQYMIIGENKLKKIFKKESLKQTEWFNFGTNKPLIAFERIEYNPNGYIYRKYIVCKLSDFISLFVKGTSVYIDDFLCPFHDILIALCEYYYLYFKNLGVRTSKLCFRKILSGCARYDLTNDERQIKFISLLSYIIELTSKNILKNGNKTFEQPIASKP